MKISSEMGVGPTDFERQNFFSQEFSQGDFLVNGTLGQDLQNPPWVEKSFAVGRYENVIWNGGWIHRLWTSKFFFTGVFPGRYFGKWYPRARSAKPIISWKKLCRRELWKCHLKSGLDPSTLDVKIFFTGVFPGRFFGKWYPWARSSKPTMSWKKLCRREIWKFHLKWGLDPSTLNVKIFFHRSFPREIFW